MSTSAATYLLSSPSQIYSVGMYVSDAVKEAVSALETAADKGKEKMSELQKGAKTGGTTFMLKMNFKVGAEKMASAIAESVAPRHQGSAAEVNELKELISNGVDGAATKGTTFQFDCNEEGLTVKVNDKEQGVVESAEISKAFCDVYLDDKAVSPTFKNSCMDYFCKEE